MKIIVDYRNYDEEEVTLTLLKKDTYSKEFINELEEKFTKWLFDNVNNIIIDGDPYEIAEFVECLINLNYQKALYYIYCMNISELNKPKIIKRR